MNNKLRILHLEDTPGDADQVNRVLKKGDLSFDIKVVATRSGFEKALTEFSPDVILSDHSLPSFDSFGALEIVKNAGIKIPFILITATVSEEVAVSLIKAGADDYILKDRMQRLPAAVVNALEKHRLENERQEYLKQVITSEAAFKEAEHIAHFGTWNLDLISGATFWSDETFHILGHEPGKIEASEENFRKNLHPDDRLRITELTSAAFRKGDSLNMEFRVLNKDDSIRYVNSRFVVECDEHGKPVKVNGFNQDITEKKEADQKLEKANRELTRVLESVEECLFSIDITKGQYTHISDVCEKVCGYKADEFYANAMLWYEMVHPDDKCVVDQSLEKLNKGESNYCEYRNIHKDGSILWVEAHVIPHLGRDGQLIYIDGIVKEITEKKKAEEAIRESEERFRLVSENPTLGIAWSSREGKVLQVNKAYHTFLRYTETEIKGLHYSKYSQADDLKRDEPFFIKLFNGEIDNYRCEKRYLTKNKEIIWGELNLASVKDKNGAVQYTIAVVQDITARKEAEAGLKALNESLEMIVTERTAELREANNELEAFSYTVSHDLRTPIRAIQIFGSLLQKKLKDATDDSIKTDLGNILKCTMEMNDLIKDLLAFSRLGRQEIVKSMVDVNEMVSEMREYLLSTKEDRDVELTIEKLPPVAADKTLLRSVWLNLLTNAIKYCRKDGPCKVEVCSKIDRDMVVYSVKDNGVGFDMKYYNKLFKPFSRLHSSAEFKGTGAGLAICDRIIKKHGGQIWAESNTNTGSTFFFSLPLTN